MNAIVELKKIKTDSAADRTCFLILLRKPLTEWDFDDLHSYYEECSANSLPEWNMGGLAFLLFSVAIYIAPSSGKVKLSDQENIAKNLLLATNENERFFTHILGFIIKEYKITCLQNETYENFEYHRSGSTSYIFKMIVNGKYNNQIVALKIPQYKYIDDGTIRAGYLEYAQRYNVGKCIPHIHAHDATYLIMNFIGGQTLLEYINKGAIKSASTKTEKFKLIYSVINRLYYALKDLSEVHGIIHKDLNPSNIILEFPDGNDERQNFKIYLIDFGVNYLLNDNIGSSQSMNNISAYIPEEVLENPRNASIMSDIYSFGVIILRALTEKIHDEDKFNKGRFEDYLDKLRLQYPLLVPILEDVLDKDPDMRLRREQFELKRDNKWQDDELFSNFKKQSLALQMEYNKCSSRLYKDIFDIIKIEHTVLVKSENDDEDSSLDIFELLSSLFDMQFGASALRIIKPSQRPKYYFNELKEDDQAGFQAQSKRLFRWHRVSDLSNMIVWIGFLFMLASFFKIPLFVKFKTVTLYDLLPALVLLSFSIIAVNYYKTIFSSLSTWRFKGGFLPKSTEIVLRLSTLFWPGPILVAFYLGHQWWAYVASFGTAIIALNNGLNYLMAKKAVRKIEEAKLPRNLREKEEVINIEEAELPQFVKDRFIDFKDWWKMMLGVSFFILVIGLLIKEKILNDEWAYLLIVLMMNLKMFKFNCTETATNVTKTLKFLYSRYDRALKYTSENNN